MPPPPQSPAERVKAPGIGLMIAGALQAVFSLLAIGYFAVMLLAQKSAVPSGSSSQDVPGLIIGGTVMVVGAIFGIGFSGMMALGGYKMMNLRSYPLALTGAILAMVAGIPCSCCAINTLVDWPIGIWALVVLADSNVRLAFQNPDLPSAQIFD